MQPRIPIFIETSFWPSPIKKHSWTHNKPTQILLTKPALRFQNRAAHSGSILSTDQPGIRGLVTYSSPGLVTNDGLVTRSMVRLQCGFD